MTAYTLDMASDPEVHPVILKAMRTAEYQPPVPGPGYAVNPDGVRYDRVTHLPSMQEPDVTEWVARHTTDGVHVMVAFARGWERAQIDPGEVRPYEVVTSAADHAAIRAAARAELNEHHRPLASTRPIWSSGPPTSLVTTRGVSNSPWTTPRCTTCGMSSRSRMVRRRPLGPPPRRLLRSVGTGWPISPDDGSAPRPAVRPRRGAVVLVRQAAGVAPDRGAGTVGILLPA